MKILCTGDLHLGRRSSRLPEHIDGRAHSSASAWGRVVDLAIAERVDLVLLSGDLIDDANRFYEALGPLEVGLRRLATAGARTVAVAGNHDHDLLPRLADSLAGDLGNSFRLLGRGGRWERTTVESKGLVVHIDGWSFPRRHFSQNPLEGYSFDRPHEGFVVGLLHADLGASASNYAPVDLATLRARHLDFWLLGHIHTPRLYEGEGVAPVLYPGSPQALDPGEVGSHGAWLFELGPGHELRGKLIPLSSVWYDEVEIDLDGLEDSDQIDPQIISGVRAHTTSIESYDALQYISYRLRLTGRTPLYREVGELVGQVVADLELVEFEGVVSGVERVSVETRPAYDLVELARSKDPVGVLAGLILYLDGETEEFSDRGYDELIEEAVREVEGVYGSSTYLALQEGGMGRRSEDGPYSEVARRALLDRAQNLLDTLLQQKETR